MLVKSRKQRNNNNQSNTTPPPNKIADIEEISIKLGNYTLAQKDLGKKLEDLNNLQGDKTTNPEKKSAYKFCFQKGKGLNMYR